MSQQPISIIDIEELMPAKEVSNEHFGQALAKTKNKMFQGVKKRRHFGEEETASDYISEATKTIMARNGLAIQDIEMILTNVSIPDQIFTGCGAVVNKKIKGKAKWIVDQHNTGCISFLYLLETARAYMSCHNIRYAIIGMVQSAAGRVFGQEDNLSLPQAGVPGDGAAVCLVENSEYRPLLVTVQKNNPEFSEDMFADYGGKHHWNAREKTGSIAFSEDKAAKITVRGNAMVPERIHEACAKLKISSTDIDFLITNQPNPLFLRNWREATLLPEQKHLHTFEKYANLFGAGIPVTLAEAVKNKTIKKGDLICLAGFSHAGDYSAATLLRW